MLNRIEVERKAKNASWIHRIMGVVMFGLDLGVLRCKMQDAICKLQAAKTEAISD